MKTTKITHLPHPSAEPNYIEIGTCRQRLCLQGHSSRFASNACRLLGLLALLWCSGTAAFAQQTFTVISGTLHNACGTGSYCNDWIGDVYVYVTYNNMVAGTYHIYTNDSSYVTFTVPTAGSGTVSAQAAIDGYHYPNYVSCVLGDRSVTGSDTGYSVTGGYIALEHETQGSAYPDCPPSVPCGANGFETFAATYYVNGPSHPSEYDKSCDRKDGGDQCKDCGSKAMARYSAHSMLASLNIEDTPIGYSPPRGPAINFTVTYNQRDAQQPQAFNYSNLGPKWTFNWLSYVTDDPNNTSANATVYVTGGGAEEYSGFDSRSQSYQPDPQSHAVLVRTAPAAYEKRFPDGSKQVFTLSDGSSSFPRKIFMTQWVDPASNAVTIGYDGSFRVTTLTDALGRVTTIAYELPGDPLKITKVTEPFSTGRYASFAYNGNGQLSSITDEIGIQSIFTYATDGTNFITSLQTPYGTSTFASGQSGSNKWIEMTDPLGGKERVEYRDNAPRVSATDPSATVPAGFTNSALDVANTFYWAKKAIEIYPPVNGVYDYTKARIVHWTYNANGSVTGIAASEKTPLENRIWNAYAGQSDTNHAGSSGNPSQVARVLGDGTTQSSRYQYNSIGKITKSIDPIGRVMAYVYDSNNIDLLEVRQTTGTANELLRKFTYNSQHEPLTDIDVAGQATTFTYNSYGQMLTRKNAKNETTSFAYGDGTSGHPIGYLTSITSPPFNSTSAFTAFAYDNANRVRAVTDSDGYTITTDYDNLDRPITVTHPDATFQQFEYSQDFGQGATTILNLTRSRDRRGLWTTRHYNANRQVDSITDPLNRTTQFGWCSCGALASITDPKNQVTAFNRDLQGRVYQKVFADNTTVNYLYDGQTTVNTVGASSRLKSSTDAKGQRANYSYFADDNIQQITYTNTSAQPLNPPTPSVTFAYDSLYNRVATMVDGNGTTTYGYNPIAAQPALGAGQLASIDGPLANDTITFAYDQLGRVTNRSINGSSNSASWTFDSLGRVSSAANKVGAFNYAYVNVTNRLSSITYPDGSSSAYAYFQNSQDKRLQEIRNQTSINALISQFDYAYDAEGQITSWTKNDSGLSAPQRFDLGYDNADQLLTAPLKNASTNALIKQYTYGYDLAANRTSELVGTTPTTSTSNNVNEIVSQSGGINRTLTYDANGSLTNDGSSRTFEWDGANRLAAINYTGTNNRTEFSYDGLSRMVKIVEKTRSRITSTRKFVWCGTEKCEFRDDKDAVTLFVYPQGQFSGKTAYFYTRDHLGSIREMRSGSGKGAIVARFDYDPYGRSTAVINTTLPDFNFTGLYRHSASNLDLAVYRAYDPNLGRWLSRDPIGEAGETNLYAYVSNDASNAVDLDGLLTLLIHGTYSSPQTFSADFRAAVSRTFGEAPVAWAWSGGNSDLDRHVAGLKLARYLKTYQTEHPCEPINIIAHSHGGNVAYIASRWVDIDTLVTLGTPFGAYMPALDNIGQLINVYSDRDYVQVNGGQRVQLWRPRIWRRGTYGPRGTLRDEY
jgi:RHS repeat-associated protein